MAGGGFTKSYNRTGRNAIQGVVDLFRNIGQRKEEDASKARMYKFINDSLSQMDNLNQPLNIAASATIPVTEQPTQRASYLGSGKDFLVDNPKIHSTNILPTKPTERVSNYNPAGFTPEGELTKTDKYNAAQDIATKYLLNVLKEGNLSPQAANQAQGFANILNNKAERIRPKGLNWENIPQGAVSVGRDEYGNVVNQIENPKEPTPRNPLTKTLANGDIAVWDEEKKQFVSTGQKAPINDYTWKPNEVKAPDVSVEEGEVARLEEQIANIDYALNEQDNGQYVNRINDKKATLNGKVGGQKTYGYWKILNPLNNTVEVMSTQKVNQLKNELKARLNKQKTARQSKVDKVYGKQKTTNLPVISY